MAERTSTTRVARHRAAKQAAVEADLAGAPPPPTREEIMRMLGVLCRKGNVAAMRALLEELRRDGVEDERVESAVDQLARRRAA